MPMLKYDLQKRPGHPLYEELYTAIKRDIVAGKLHAGEKLPSKRQMAADNDVSLTTVLNAYDQLATEGFVNSEQRKGYFVAHIEPLPSAPRKPPSPRAEHAYYRETQWFADFRSNNTLYRYFPYATWKKVIRQILSEYETELVVRGNPFGIRALREQIAAYLYRTRGINASPERIVIGAGIEYLYARLITLFPRGTIYSVENPGYRKIPQIYEAYNLRWKSVAMDESGVSIADLRTQDVNLVHVSPEHHYPLGTTMPMSRRQELLAWAREDSSRYIIEDDFDCEFRYGARSIPALASLDAAGRVIYMNTFSKTLSPAVRISYMVLPEALMERYIEKTHFFTNSTSSLEQYALARFIEQGYFERHLSLIKKKYRQEGETLRALLRESSIPIEKLSAAKSGTHLLVKLDTQMSDAAVKRKAANLGVNVGCVSDYCWDSPGNSGTADWEPPDENTAEYRAKAASTRYAHTLILNFSDLDEETQREAIHRLGTIFA